jgi:hypothetical protein
MSPRGFLHFQTRLVDHPLPDCELLDLFRHPLREAVDELDAARHFKVGQVFATEFRIQSLKSTAGRESVDPTPRLGKSLSENLKNAVNASGMSLSKEVLG